MAFALSVFDAQVNNLLSGDTDLLSLLARYRNITSAVEKYSGDRPLTTIAEVTGDAGQYYPIASNLTGWNEGTSQITQIEYPAAAVASDEAPTYLDPEDWDDAFWAMVSTVTTRLLYLPHHSPAATETMRITYTQPYAWAVGGATISVAQTTHGFTADQYLYLDGATYYAAGNVQIATHRVVAVTDAGNFTCKMLAADIPPADFFAVCHWAAGLCCQAMAAKFAQSKDSTFAVDSATHASKSSDYAARAQEFFALYNQHMGIAEEGAGAVQASRAAGEFVDWDTEPGWPGNRRFIFHHGDIR